MTSNALFHTSPKPWAPHNGQRLGLHFMLGRANAGILASPGMGKTSLTYGALTELRRQGLVRKTLIVAPLRPAHLVWPAEARKWEQFQDLRVVVLHGPRKDELLNTPADVYVINPAGLPWLCQADKAKSFTGKTNPVVNLEKFKALGFDHLVLDELTFCKNTNTQTFKLMKQIIKTFSRRWGLTGTPVPNGMLDLFGQAYVLDEGKALGPYITNYRSKYFIPSFDGFTWKIRPGAEQEIYDRVQSLFLRLDAADYFDMPAEVHNLIWTEMPSAARKVYQAMEDDFVTQIDSGQIAASNSAVASGKCRQIASGAIYLQDAPGIVRKTGPKDWEVIHGAKIEALGELIDELNGQQVLVAYQFKHEIERIKQLLGDDIAVFGVSSKRDAEIERLWNAGELPYVFGHPASIGHGLNLQGSNAKHLCFFSQTWDREHYEQLIARIRRQGNTSEHIFVHHIMVKNTIEPAMHYAVKAKGNVQDAFFKALKEMRLK